MTTAKKNESQDMVQSSAEAATPIAAQAAPGQTPAACAPNTWESVSDSLPDEEMLYDLADLFKVFADTTRIKILYALMIDDMCVACIAETVGASQSAVSHQLRILKQARLVKFRREGKQVIYSLSDDHVHTVLAQGMSHICE